MAFVSSYNGIKRNIEYLERHHGSQNHRDYVKLGICFVVYDAEKGVAFAPSRFLGYEDNTFEEHARNAEKDGRETNPAISSIVGTTPQSNDSFEKAYKSYCASLGFTPNPKGSFGVERKYRDCRGRK